MGNMELISMIIIGVGGPILVYIVRLEKRLTRIETLLEIISQKVIPCQQISDPNTR